MAIPAHVSRDFKNLNAFQKVSFGENVIVQLTAAAATFPGLPFPVATLTATTAALNTAQSAALGGDHQLVAEAHAAEALWDEQFEETAAQVDKIAKGDVAIILLSGFKATKTERTPATLPDAPQILQVITNQQPGSLHVELNVMKGVTFIIIISSDPTLPVFDDGLYVTASNPKVVAMLIDSGRKVDITGLPTRSTLFVSAVALNNAGFGPASPPVAANTL